MDKKNLNGVLETVIVTYISNNKIYEKIIQVPIGTTCEQIENMQLEKVDVLYYETYGSY